MKNKRFYLILIAFSLLLAVGTVSCSLGMTDDVDELKAQEPQGTNYVLYENVRYAATRGHYYVHPSTQQLYVDLIAGLLNVHFSLPENFLDGATHTLKPDTSRPETWYMGFSYGDFTYYAESASLKDNGISGGTVTVKCKGNAPQQVAFDFQLTNGKRIKGEYVGEFYETMVCYFYNFKP